MPGENIQDWSTTAANNATADSSINFVENQTRASLNDSCRSVMAALAKDRNLTNGSITTAGTGNAQTFSSGLSYTSVPTGLKARLKIGVGLSNTGATTLNMDGIGAVTIKNQDGVDLIGGALVPGTYRDFEYNGTNWILLSVPELSIAKAWLIYNGSAGTIYTSYGVSSVTKNGVGDYTVNFTTAFASATGYAWTAAAGGGVAAGTFLVVAPAGADPTASTFRCRVVDDTGLNLVDPVYLSLVFFGDQ